MAWWIWPDLWFLDIGVLLLAFALDMVLREPPAALHPVVWIGKAISFLEKVMPQASPTTAFMSGVAIAIIVPIVSGGIAWIIVLGLQQLGPVVYLIGGSILLKTTFAVKGLAQAAIATRDAMQAEADEEAKGSLRSLVSRDATTLSRPMVAAAAIESVAENTTDSFIGPWMAFVLLGIPGAFAYRAINTLDSMIGYRGRYEYLGKASARLDDFVNLIPARISALLIVEVAALKGRLLPSWRTMIQEHSKTESPNAGWTIGAMSGYLGIALEKPDHYRIGEGLREPEVSDIDGAVRMAYGVAVLGLLLSIGFLSVIRFTLA